MTCVSPLLPYNLLFKLFLMQKKRKKKISGMVRAAKENQDYASTMNKGVLLDLEGEFAERKNKRVLFEVCN